MLLKKNNTLFLSLLGCCVLLAPLAPVLAAPEAYWSDPGPPGTPSGPPLPPPSGTGLTTFSYNGRDAGLAPGTTAGDAFDLAASYVAGWLQDPVDVVLELELTDLPGTGLAEAFNFNHSEGFNSARAAMIIDQQDHVGIGDITDDLPSFAQLNVQLPTVGAGWSLGGSMEMTRANAKALGLVSANATDTDSIIRFDSGTLFDYNPFDGIDPGTYDFVGIAVHEIGHALGFDSEVDKADLFWGTSGVALDLSPMDMFRLLPGEGALDFKNATRILTTGDDPSGLYGTQVSYQGLGFEAGLSVAGADYQASHWKDAMGLGIMDPTFAAGEGGVPTYTDWRVFDLIGWDTVEPINTPVPAAVWLFGSGLALLGFAGKRRRTT